MGLQLRFRLGKPKTEKYKEFNRCRCFQMPTEKTKHLYIEFEDEYNGFIVRDTNCSIKQCKIALYEYFEIVELER